MHLGLDFGTCFSSAAFVRSGIPLPVNFDYSKTSLPSTIYVTSDDEILAGLDAENAAMDEPARLRREFKRDLGSNKPYILGQVRLLPEQMVAVVLQQLTEKAKEQASTQFKRAVVTVPASYARGRRRLMEEAAHAAGFEGVTLLDEPVAAGHYFGWWRAQEPLPEGGLLLVYDLGGGTFDAALIRKHGSSFETFAQPMGSDRLGGASFDSLILEDLRHHASSTVVRLLDPASYPQTATGLLACRRTRLRITDECRHLKHRLSRSRQAAIDFTEAPGDRYTLTQEAFERLIAPAVAESLDICDKLLVTAGVKSSQLAAVLLVGGSCRIPYLQRAVAAKLGRPVILAGDPALAVCLGAALYGDRLEQVQKEESGRWAGHYRVEDDDVFTSFAEPQER